MPHNPQAKHGWWSKIKVVASEVSNVSLCAVRRWWRPVVCISIGGSVLLNGVILPAVKGDWPDLLGLAALITAAAPFAWLRTQEKLNGVDAPKPRQPDGD